VNVVCETLQNNLGTLYQCSDMGQYQRIRTPYLYPDGDVIDLYVNTTNPEVWVISDLAETTRWLRMQTQTMKRSVKQRQLIEDVSLTHGVQWRRGMLQARYFTDGSKGTLADVVTRVAQAAIRVSDVWFTMRSRAVQSATDEIAEFLDEHAIRYERQVRLNGRSQQPWVVDFQTYTPNQMSLLHVLSSNNRSSAQNHTHKVVAMWHDLQYRTVGSEGLQLVSLFDDTSDVWRETDFARVAELSIVARWSRLDELPDILQAA
jgi:hypothetical protein